MYALVKNGIEKGAEYIKIEDPKPKQKEVVIDVNTAAICGTDMHLYNWDEAAANFTKNFKVNFPLILGHEVAGTVVETGPEVERIKKGDRVALETHIFCGNCYQCETGNRHNCQNMGLYGITYNGAFTNFAVAPEKIVFRLPDSVSFEEGAIFEPAGVAMHGIEEASIQPGDVVLVYGCGPVGLFAIQIANASGASKVIVIDINSYRLKMAEQLGAITINADKQDIRSTIKNLCKHKGGVDVALEVTGSTKVYENIFELIKLEGRLVIIGHPSSKVAVNITKNINQKGLTIKGIFGRRVWDSWWKLASLVESNKIDISKIITHRFSLNNYKKAFGMTGGEVGKILFKM